MLSKSISFIPAVTVYHFIDNSTNITSSSTSTSKIALEPSVAPVGQFGGFDGLLRVEIIPHAFDKAGTAVATVTTLDVTALTSTTSTVVFPTTYIDYAASFVVEQGVSNQRVQFCRFGCTELTSVFTERLDYQQWTCLVHDVQLFHWTLSRASQLCPFIGRAA